MPNVYKKGTAVIYLRLPEEWKKRLYTVAKTMDKSATALARDILIERIQELEKKIK
jgi:predicted DNA-binding protein